MIHVEHSSSSRGSNRLIDVDPASDMNHGGCNAPRRIKEVGEMNM